MVKFLKICFCCWFFTGSVMAIDISAGIDDTPVLSDVPIRGTVTISHDSNEKIDLQSFLIGSEPLKVEKIKDVQISPYSSLILTLFRFNLDPKLAGNYVLPQISATVAGKPYQSSPVNYEVEKRSALNPGLPTGSNPSSSQSLANPVMRLEASVDGPTTLYPSERTRVVYRYFFNPSVALTVEKLPLLDAEGFIKIGEKDVRDVQVGGISATEISQVIEASMPGTYTLGPSVIEGYAYLADADGNVIEKSKTLKSEASPITLTVLPFVQQDRPPAFNGAVGDFTFSVELKGTAKVSVGEDLSLILKIEGEKNIEVVPLPDVCCQPGFVGAFLVSDLPPVELTQGKVKTATVVLKPLSSAIHEIPPLTFSFFNPTTQNYVSLLSKPISIGVNPIKRIEVKEETLSVSSDKNDLGFPPLQLKAIASLTQADLHSLALGSSFVVLLLPLGIVGVIYQLYLQNYLASRKRQIKQSSGYLLMSCKNEPFGSSAYFELLTLSLKQRLVESGAIKSLEIPEEMWPQKGACVLVKDWIFALEEQRFSGRKLENPGQFEQEVEKLFAQIPVPGIGPGYSSWQLYGPLLILGFLFVLIAGASSLHRHESLLDPAKTKSYGLYLQQSALVEVVNQYQELSHEYSLKESSGNLYKALASSYAELGRLPEALWQARNALALNPRDPELPGFIKKMEELLFLKEYPQIDLSYYLPTLPQWHQLFGLVIGFAFLVSSYAVWWPKALSNRLFKWSAFAAFIACLPLIYTYYFSPLMGTVLVSSDLKAGPSRVYPKVGEEPVPSGSSIEVVGISEDGKWLQVFTPSGGKGYLPSISIGL